MKSKQANFARPSPTRSWLISVCLLLIVMTATAQALHLHPADLVQDVKHCPICQVAHTVVQVALVGGLCFSLNATAYLSSPADADPKSALESFALFSRPPPLV